MGMCLAWATETNLKVENGFSKVYFVHEAIAAGNGLAVYAPRISPDLNNICIS